jgi:uncharacterized protein (TIGR00255 family)
VHEVRVILSMTGYGTGEAERDGVAVKVELRAVNHRYFDPQIRISQSLPGWESRVRELLGKRVSRGRLTVNVDVESERTGTTVVLDEGVASEYLRVLQFLHDRFQIAGTVDPVAFAQLPDVIRRDGVGAAAVLDDAALVEACERALDELDDMRRREGEAIARDFRQRIERIVETLNSIDALARELPARIRRRLEERIEMLVPQGVVPDVERLATEVALLAERADLAEELVRFRAHADAFLGFLVRDEPVGKRLDFLLQEMNREANTIGSKAAQAEISHRVVELKEEIERLREQVQNVE